MPAYKILAPAPKFKVVAPRRYRGKAVASNPTVSVQPMPVELGVAHHRTSKGEWVTAISRKFLLTDIPRCQLCPKAECNTSASGNCLVIVGAYVPESCASLFARPGSLAARLSTSGGNDV